MNQILTHRGDDHNTTNQRVVGVKDGQISRPDGQLQLLREFDDPMFQRMSEITQHMSQLLKSCCRGT